MRSRLDPVKKVVNMLRRHQQGLLNYSLHRISNACAEGFNSAIQLIKANARGFRNFQLPCPHSVPGGWRWGWDEEKITVNSTKNPFFPQCEHRAIDTLLVSNMLFACVSCPL